MKPALIVILFASSTGCLASRDLGGTDDGAAGASDDAAESDGADTSDGLSASDGASESPTTSGDSGVPWPPDDGFDPTPDVGDGTLDDDVLLVASTPSGTLFLFAHAERKGDSVQIWMQPAAFDGSSWAGAGTEVFTNAGVDDNGFSIPVEDLTLPPGTHPFGEGPVTLDLAVHGLFYADELLCGTLDVDLPAGEDVSAAPFVATPIDEVGADPNPPLACD